MSRGKTKKTKAGFNLTGFIADSALSRSIAEIRGLSNESRSTEFATSVAERIEIICYDKKLKDLTGEDIAALLIQEFEADLIIPLALSRVHKDLDSEGYFPGHLAELLLKVSPETWAKNPLLWRSTTEWIESNRAELRSRNLKLQILDLHI